LEFLNGGDPVSQGFVSSRQLKMCLGLFWQQGGGALEFTDGLGFLPSASKLEPRSKREEA